MSVPQSVADVIGRHGTFETESIDRRYLNVYQPILQTGGGVSTFFRAHRGEAFATALVISRMTQVLDRPLAGCVFFERVIRDNIDLGRPRNVQLVFDRRIIKTTPSRFRTLVITHGVVPSLWIEYKSSTIKQ